MTLSCPVLFSALIFSANQQGCLLSQSMVSQAENTSLQGNVHVHVRVQTFQKSKLKKTIVLDVALKLIQSYTELDHHNLILEHFMPPVHPSSLPGSCISIPYSRQEVYIDDR